MSTNLNFTPYQEHQIQKMFFKKIEKKLKKKFYSDMHKKGCHLSNIILEVLLDYIDADEPINVIQNTVSEYVVQGYLDIDQVKIPIEEIIKNHPDKNKLNWDVIRKEQKENNKEVLEHAKELLDKGKITEKTCNNAASLLKKD